MMLNTSTAKNIGEHLLEKILISKLYLPYNCKKLIAFTLAEVLITLLIIGIVASIVIPALIQETQEAEYRVAFKKGMATFSQAFMRMRMDNGGTLAGVFSSNHSVFENIFRQYLNISQYSSTNILTPNLTWHDYLNYKKLNGQYETYSGIVCTACPSAQFHDGSFFLVKLSWVDSNLTSCNLNGTNPREGLCFNIVYDVNGKKSPNIFGKDIYVLAVYKDKVVPADWVQGIGGINESSCTTSSTGYGCAIKYAKE